MKQKLVFTCILFLALSFTLSAQNKTSNNDTSNLENEEIYMIIEEAATYKGGLPELSAFLKNNIVYPASAKKAEIEGTVYIQFVVTKNGKIARVKALNNPNDALTAEAIRIILAMPDWIAGKHRGIPQNSYFTIPVKFTLGNDNVPE